MKKMKQFGRGGRFSDYYYLTVDLDERGEYAATVYDAKDSQVWDCDTEFTRELIDDGFLKYKPDEDLEGLSKYLSDMDIIKKDGEIISEAAFEKLKDEDDVLEFTIPIWALCSLVNGDDSGLNEDDIERLNKFCERIAEKYGNANFMLGSEEQQQSFFAHSNDIDKLGSDCEIMLLRPTKEYAQGGGVGAKDDSSKWLIAKEKIAKDLSKVHNQEIYGVTSRRNDRTKEYVINAFKDAGFIDAVEISNKEFNRMKKIVPYWINKYGCTQPDGLQIGESTVGGWRIAKHLPHKTLITTYSDKHYTRESALKNFEIKYAEELSEYEKSKMERGGGVGSIGKNGFQGGDVVWDREHKCYGTVLMNYGNPFAGEHGEIRLDSDGNVNVFEYDKEQNAIAYNLIKQGEEGDKGTKAELEQYLKSRAASEKEYGSYAKKYGWAKNKKETGGTVDSSSKGIFNNTVLKSIFGF